MPIITLKLKVSDEGSDHWQVYLQEMKPENIVHDWHDEDPLFIKELVNYDTGKNALTIFVKCSGPGCTVYCDVYINHQIKGSIEAHDDDRRAASRTFKL